MSLRKFVFVALIPILSLTVHAKEGSSSPAKSGKPTAFRVVPIAERVGGLMEYRPVVITSKKQLADEIARVKDNPSLKTRENLKREIEGVINRSKLDFSKEALVLLPHYEPSGSNRVSFRRPVLEKDILKCKITRKVPEVGTDDEASYCFALVVSKSAVKKVDLHVDKRKTTELLILEKGSQSARDDSDLIDEVNAALERI